MRRVLRCRRCSVALKVLPAGFNTSETLYCPDRGTWVDDDDGCTFGANGEPERATVGQMVSVESSAAVYGRCDGPST